MIHILKRVSGYGIGTRPQSEEDFYRICEAEGIDVLWSDTKFSFYFTILGEHFITLPKRRRGLRLLHAMFHELGHYFAHTGTSAAAAFLSNRHSKDEAEADAVALIAMIPKHLIVELAEDFGQTRYGDKLWRERNRLHFLYGI